MEEGILLIMYHWDIFLVLSFLLNRIKGLQQIEFLV